MNGSPVGFNIRENKESTDIVTASTLLANFTKLFSFCVISEKHIHHHLKRWLKHSFLSTGLWNRVSLSSFSSRKIIYFNRLKNLINKVALFHISENQFFAYLTDVESTGLFIKNMLTHNRLLIGTFNQIYSFYHFWNK